MIMMKCKALNVALAVVVALTHISSVQAGNYYIATHGNDANPGTLA